MKYIQLFCIVLVACFVSAKEEGRGTLFAKDGKLFFIEFENGINTDLYIKFQIIQLFLPTSILN